MIVFHKESEQYNNRNAQFSLRIDSKFLESWWSLWLEILSKRIKISLNFEMPSRLRKAQHSLQLFPQLHFEQKSDTWVSGLVQTFKLKFLWRVNTLTIYRCQHLILSTSHFSKWNCSVRKIYPIFEKFIILFDAVRKKNSKQNLHTISMNIRINFLYRAIVQIFCFVKLHLVTWGNFTCPLNYHSPYLTSNLTRNNFF